MSNPPNSREYIPNEFRSPLAIKNPKNALKTTSEDRRNFTKETNAFGLVIILIVMGSPIGPFSFGGEISIIYSLIELVLNLSLII